LYEKKKKKKKKIKKKGRKKERKKMTKPDFSAVCFLAPVYSKVHLRVYL